MYEPISVHLGMDPNKLNYANKLDWDELVASNHLNNLAGLFYANSVQHGFYDEPRDFDRTLMLIVGEVTEAHEEFRDGRPFTQIYYREHDGKPEGIPTELADILIRLLDTAAHLGIDIAAAVAEKHAFNKTRPHKHGRQF